MRKCKKYLKRCLASVLAVTMAFGTSTINWAEPSGQVEKKDLVVYFANWDVYNNEYGQVKDLPWEKVTYINHAFWEIEPQEGGTYKIQSTDAEADITGTKAHFTQYAEYSETYPDVNVMLSIGGWTRCGYFSEMANTATGRESFINSCIETMDTYTFIDGIDVDWEYPGVERLPEGDSDEGCPVVGDDYANYTLLLKEMREAFDAKYGAGAKKITTCSSVNVETLEKQDVAAIAEYVDLINIMSYDMTGSYDSVTGHHSALNTVGDAHSVVKGVEYFLAKGVPASKINIGTPLYCHGWGSVTPGPEGELVGVAGSAEGYTGDKNWNILKAIELLVVEDGEMGWHKGYDEAAEAAYLYNDNPNSKYYQNFLTYEDEQSVKAKLDYIREKDLAGMIIWQNGGDSIVDDYPMITQMAISLGIYSGEQTVYGQAGQIPEIDDTVSSAGYPDPVLEVVAGDGSKTFAAGTYIYYNGAVWKSIMDTASDWPANLPDGEWGASCWEKAFDVKTYVSQEELRYWDWAADAGEYVFYDPDKDEVGGIYLATAQTSNTANDAPDGIWGTNWQYITTVKIGAAAKDNGIPDPLTETVAGDGSKVFPAGTYIYYKNALWKSTNDNSNDWPDNLPDGSWGASCFAKEFDVKTYVSQEENNGEWAWAADAGEYVFYDPDKDGTGGIYLATAQTSNTANDAPDGIWGTNWEYITTIILASNQEEETTSSEETTTVEETTTGSEAETTTSEKETTTAPTTEKETTTVANAEKETTSASKKDRIIKAKRTSKRKAKITIREAKGATSYEIQISRKKDFSTKTKRTIKTTKLTKTIKGLKTGKTYYVRVRAVIKIYGVKFRSKWSKTKKIRATVKK